MNKENFKKYITESRITSALFDLSGWKRDVIRIGIVLVIVAILFGTVSLYRFTINPAWDMRFTTPVTLEKRSFYEHESTGISFWYSDQFVLDTNEEKRYGSEYISGIHLEHDRRTGCDIRSSDTGLNFSKGDEDIVAALEKEISSTAQGFEKRTGERILISGNPAFRFDFSFVDPLGSRVRINQIMTSKGDAHYLILCGGNEDIYDLLQKDFESFLQSIVIK